MKKQLTRVTNIISRKQPSVVSKVRERVIQLEHPKINCDTESTPMNNKNEGVETGKCIPRRVGGQDRELKPTGLLGKLKHVQNIDKNLIQGKLKTNGQMKLQ